MIDMRNLERFIEQMKGQDPQKLIQDLIQSGKVTQAQLNAAQKEAKEIEEEMRRLMGFSSR